MYIKKRKRRPYGIDIEFWPTVYEMFEAEKIFKKSIEKNYSDVANGEMKEETCIKIAIGDVWSAARKYQSEKEKTNG